MAGLISVIRLCVTEGSQVVLAVGVLRTGLPTPFGRAGSAIRQGRRAVADRRCTCAAQAEAIASCGASPYGLC